MANIIIKNYEHINSALPNWDTPKGKYIKNKAHYENEMKKSGMISVDNVNHKSSRKDYKLSPKAREIIKTASNSKDSKGNVKLSDRTIDAMRSIGALKGIR